MVDEYYHTADRSESSCSARCDRLEFPPPPSPLLPTPPPPPPLPSSSPPRVTLLSPQVINPVLNNGRHINHQILNDTESYVTALDSSPKRSPSSTSGSDQDQDRVPPAAPQQTVTTKDDSHSKPTRNQKMIKKAHSTDKLLTIKSDESDREWHSDHYKSSSKLNGRLQPGPGHPHGGKLISNSITSGHETSSKSEATVTTGTLSKGTEKSKSLINHHPNGIKSGHNHHQNYVKNCNQIKNWRGNHSSNNHETRKALTRQPTDYYEHLYSCVRKPAPKDVLVDDSKRSVIDPRAKSSNQSLCAGCLHELSKHRDRPSSNCQSSKSRLSGCKSYQSLSMAGSHHMHHYHQCCGGGLYNCDHPFDVELARGESKSVLKLRKNDRKEKLVLFAIMLVNIAFFVAFCFLGVLFLNYIKFP